MRSIFVDADGVEALLVRPPLCLPPDQPSSHAGAAPHTRPGEWFSGQPVLHDESLADSWEGGPVPMVLYNGLSRAIDGRPPR